MNSQLHLSRFVICLLLSGSILCIFHRNAVASEGKQSSPVLIMTHMQPKDSKIGCWLNTFYSEAFRRLGYQMEYMHAPAARGTKMSFEGKSDGELGRIEQYGESNPNIIRIDEPHLSVDFCAYTTFTSSEELDWDQIKHSEHKIAITRGIHKVESVLHEQENRIHFVRNDLSGLRMLKLNRVDIYIGPSSNVDKLLQTEEFMDGIIHKSGSLETHNAHAYLHKRHSKLAPELARTIKSMKSEGLHKKFAEECGFQN